MNQLSGPVDMIRSWTCGAGNARWCRSRRHDPDHHRAGAAERRWCGEHHPGAGVAVPPVQYFSSRVRRDASGGDLTEGQQFRKAAIDAVFLFGGVGELGEVDVRDREVVLDRLNRPRYGSKGLSRLITEIDNEQRVLDIDDCHAIRDDDEAVSIVIAYGLEHLAGLGPLEIDVIDDLDVRPETIVRSFPASVPARPARTAGWKSRYERQRRCQCGRCAACKDDSP